jgi:apolipoprotein N-acyltransferase
VSRGRRGLWVAGHAAATFLAFPHPIGGRVLDLGWLFAWIAPALLLLALRGLPPRRAAAAGFAAGWLAHTAVLHWIYVVTVDYGHAPVAVGLLAPALLAVYSAIFSAAFGGVYAGLAARGLANPLAVAVLWTAVDHARSFVFTGFPWATLGYAQHESAALLPLAAFTGVYGLSFASALGGAALVALAEGRRRAAAAAAAGVALLHALGLALAPVPLEGPRVRVAVLQGNIEQGVKWSPEWRERTFATYARLSRQAATRGARLVVWPETALPGALEADAALVARVASLARETQAWLVIGGVGLEWGEGERPSRYFDSAFVVDPEGRIRDRYDKSHLVPFGEYVPLRDLLGFFLRSVARGIAPSDVAPGARPRSVRVAPEGGDGFPVGVAICFELLFPDLVRRFPADGGELLLGITNDAWYGRTGAPYQFLAITALRSAETGLWTARSANTGVSAFIDAAGRVREQTPIFEEGLLVADVPRHPSPRSATFYVRHGDLFALACWLGTAGLGATAWRRRVASRAPRAPMSDSPSAGRQESGSPGGA